MNASQAWLIAAIILFVLEIITPGFVLANFAVASMAAAVAAWFGAAIELQVIVFVVAALVSFVSIRPLLRRTLLKEPALVPTGTDALVGRQAIVTDAIPRPPATGRVKVDGDSWAAISASGEPIAENTVVTVQKVDSTTLIVS